jgi:hypothetical protein
MENKDVQIQVERAGEIIKQKIYIIRGYKVMFDSDLAEPYGVSTGRFNEQVKRNISRFPPDFAFKLNDEEFKSLISQIAISKVGRGGRRHMPYVFIEHGVAMLSAILSSERAVQMSIFIVRAFIKMRESLDQYKDLSIKINDMELEQKEQGILLIHVHSAVRDLISKQVIEKPLKKRAKIGFQIK